MTQLILICFMTGYQSYKTATVPPIYGTFSLEERLQECDTTFGYSQSELDEKPESYALNAYVLKEKI